MSPAADGNETKLTPGELYAQICTNIRATDDISFKLLGFVPLISGGAIVGLLLTEQVPWSGTITFVSGFAAIVTFGLFRWEMRNIQTCNWLRRRAKSIDGAPVSDPPRFLGISVGKTEAERIVYSTTMGGWLALPGAMAKVNGAEWPDVILRSALLVATFFLVAYLLARGAAWLAAEATDGETEKGSIRGMADQGQPSRRQQ
jgi:hypothetical protein